MGTEPTGMAVLCWSQELQIEWHYIVESLHDRRIAVLLNLNLQPALHQRAVIAASLGRSGQCLQKS